MAARVRFYHGSSRPLDVGQRIGGRPNELLEPVIEEFLESQRPRVQPSRMVAAFMVSRKQDVEIAGGSLGYVYEVEPLAAAYPHQLYWYTRIRALVQAHRRRRGIQVQLYIPDASLVRARRFADAYWSGEDADESQDSRWAEPWEYLTRSAVVIQQIRSPRRRYDE